MFIPDTAFPSSATVPNPSQNNNLPELLPQFEVHCIYWFIHVAVQRAFCSTDWFRLSALGEELREIDWHICKHDWYWYDMSFDNQEHRPTAVE
jgi:hypothetical protein